VSTHPLRRIAFGVLVSLALVLGISGQATAVSPDIVVSQVYGGGGNSGATLKNDFVELFNRGSTSVDVTGWSVQYASAAGNSWARTELSGSIPPGRYYLVQEAAGANTTATPLPTPDATGTIAMSATGGKVALVTNQTPLTCGGASGGSCLPNTAIKDFVGYGIADNSETAATPALSNTTAALRAANGCTDTDSNSTDFAVGSPNPRNSASPANPCVAADTAPFVSSTSPATSATNVAGGTNVSITFSEPVDVAGSWFTISCLTSGAHSATVSGGPTAFTLDPDVSFTPGESCTVTVVATQVSDQDTVDPPDLMQADHAFSFGVGSPCDDPFTPAHSIQGSGPSAAVTGNVTVEGVVVGDFEGTAGLQGFYLQDATGDGNAATSDGIFVFTGSADTVSPGQLVRATGFARERFNQTALNGTNSNGSAVTNIVQCGSGSVAPTPVTMPFAAVDFPERFEGMLVRFPQSLVISEYFNYDRFGEIVLGLPLEGETRHFAPTSIVEPGGPAQARLADYLVRRIILDDGLSTSNPESTRHPNGAPFSLANSFRGGDTVRDALGVIGFDFSLYRIYPTAPAVYTAANPRPAPPETPDGVRVATMNTLNYFVTLDIEPNTTPRHPLDEKCGPAQTLECRGADSNQPDEFTRQRTKLLAALAGLDADVIGLNELENTAGVDPLEDSAKGIVPGLNAMAGVGPYDAIDTGTIGTDAIKVGFIYRSNVVRPVGDFKLLTSAVDPRFIDTRSRPALAQTFEVIATGARFTVAINHLKSKGSACEGDPDTGDGAGNCNQTRKAAAEALVDWLATDPTGSNDPDFLIMGDLNAYAKEDPIDAVKAGPDGTLGTGDDYTNLVEKYEGEFAYSFVFDGQAGYLDHGLANSAIVDQVLGAAEWHINADEPDLLDYDTTFKSAAQDTYYEPNQFRSADHDPLVVTLCGDLTACAIDRLEAVADRLEELIASANTKTRDKLEDVLDKVESALRRLERARPNRQGAAGELEGAAGDLQAAVKQGVLGTTPGNELLGEIAQIVRLLAVDAIEEAKAGGGKADKIAEAERLLARGDTRLTAGRFKDAVAAYEDALSKAEGA
jgi:predicted extracellular nuclease